MSAMLVVKRSFALLFVLLLFACVNNANQQLFEQYYEPFAVQLNPDAAVHHPELDTAYLAYQNGDYATVERITTTFLEEYYSVPQVMFAQSIAFVELNRDEEAINNFRTLAMHPFFGSQAQWYLSLVYIRNGRLEEAKPLLEKLGRSYDPEKEKALALLKDLVEAG